MVSQDIKDKLSSHTALNIYFWVAFLGIPYLLGMGEHKHDQPNMRALATFAIFYGVIVYFNNLFLLPKFFQQKKYFPYFASLGVLIALWALMQVNFHQIFFGCDCIISLDTSSFSKASIQTLTFVGGFSAFKLLRDYQKKESDYIELEKEKLQNELQLLKGQISPHFLFNTLNSLYASALEKSDDLPEIILKLSGMLRYMLYECNVAYVSVEKELQYLKNYIELQEIRLEGQGGIIKYEEKDIVRGGKIAPAILINLVENAFKYGFDQVENKPEVKISIQMDGNNLLFTSQNTFALQENKISKKAGGIGLQNVQQRLNLIYDGRHQLNIKEEYPYFFISLKLILN